MPKPERPPRSAGREAAPGPGGRGQLSQRHFLGPTLRGSDAARRAAPGATCTPRAAPAPRGVRTRRPTPCAGARRGEARSGSGRASLPSERGCTAVRQPRHRAARGPRCALRLRQGFAPRVPLFAVREAAVPPRRRALQPRRAGSGSDFSLKLDTSR